MTTKSKPTGRGRGRPPKTQTSAVRAAIWEQEQQERLERDSDRAMIEERSGPPRWNQRRFKAAASFRLTPTALDTLDKLAFLKCMSRAGVLEVLIRLEGAQMGVLEVNPNLRDVEREYENWVRSRKARGRKNDQAGRPYSRDDLAAQAREAFQYRARLNSPLDKALYSDPEPDPEPAPKPRPRPRTALPPDPEEYET